MIRIAIVDDSTDAIQNCKKIISEMNLPDIQVDTYEDSTQFCDAFFRKMESFDIIILDIDMPDVNGFEIAGNIREMDMDVIVIFHTAYDQYVFKAYEYQPFRYIRKEYCAEELPFALSCALERIKTESKKYLYINTGDSIYKVLQSNIYVIESDKHYCDFVTKSHGVIRARVAISKLKDDLDENIFISANKGTFVNLAHIERITDGVIIMDNESIVPISRRKIKSVKDAFVKFLGDNV